MQYEFLYILIIIVPTLLYMIFSRMGGKKNKIKYGDFEGQIKKYSIRIQMDLNDTNAFYERGLAYIKAKNRQLALADLKIASKLGHERADEVIAQHNLDPSHHHIEGLNSSGNYNSGITSEYSGAIQDYDKVIISNPNNPLAYLMRAGVKDLSKDHRGAIADLTKAIKYNHKYAEAYFKRGVIKLKIDDIKGAKIDLEFSLSLGFTRAKAQLAKINIPSTDLSLT